MSNYNLSDNVNDSFQFSINGLVYKMRYPLVSEIEELQEKTKLIEKKKKEDKDVTKEEQDLEKWMYSFTDPVEPSSPPIKELLEKQNIKVMQNFQTMFKTEFGATE